MSSDVTLVVPLSIVISSASSQSINVYRRWKKCICIELTTSAECNYRVAQLQSAGLAAISQSCSSNIHKTSDGVRLRRMQCENDFFDGQRALYQCLETDGSEALLSLARCYGTSIIPRTTLELTLTLGVKDRAQMKMYNNIHRIFSALTNNGRYNPIYSYIEPESNHRQAVIPVADVGFEESIGNWLVIR